MSSEEVISKLKKINLEFVSLSSMKEVHGSISKSRKDSLNLLIGSFYFSAEFLKYILNKKKLDISLGNLEKIIS